MGNCSGKINRSECPIPSGYIKQSECPIPEDYVRRTECQIPEDYVRRTECPIPEGYVTSSSCIDVAKSNGYVKSCPQQIIYGGESFNIRGKSGFISSDPTIINNSPLTTSTQPTSPLWTYDYKNKRFVHKSGKCINNSAYTIDGGAPFQYWDCNDWSYQRWRYDYETRQIRSVDNPERCLTEVGGGFYSGYACDPSREDQKFSVSS